MDLTVKGGVSTEIPEKVETENVDSASTTVVQEQGKPAAKQWEDAGLPEAGATGAPPVATGDLGSSGGVNKDQPSAGMQQISPAAAYQAENDKVVRIVVKPTRRTSTTVHWALPHNFELKPGEVLVFEVPQDLRGSLIRGGVIAHRKDSKYKASVSKDGWDSQGAYNLIQARDTTTGNWVTWSDQYGSKKFAEPRSSGDPEYEGLHDWLASVGPRSVDMIKVTNVGHGELAVATVHHVEAEFFPPQDRIDPSLTIEEIFTEGTRFVDLDKALGSDYTARQYRKPTYGGGMGGHLSHSVIQEHGLYPGSVVLGGYGAASGTKPEQAYVQGGKLHIPLPAGKVFEGFETAVGDTGFNPSRPISEQKNKDGHIGQLGWAKLYARIENKNTHQRQPYIIERANVPPSGVISGGPAEAGGYVVQEGDELVVSAQGYKTWMMGYRVQFSQPKDPDAA